MKKLSYFWLAVSVFLSIPSMVFSSFEIEMKNGTRFVTDRYWEEAGMIKFNLYGGETAFSMDKIKSIKESDKEPVVIKEEPTGNIDQPPAMQKDKTPVDSVAGKEDKIDPPKISEDQKLSFLEKETQIQSEINAITSAFQQAKKCKNKKEIRVQRKRLLDSQTKMQALSDEVKKANGGEDPEWWPVRCTEAK